jgi:hypothetical protein
MKIGTLVTNDTLGNGIVVEKYGKNSMMVRWYGVKTSPTMIITKRLKTWYAPSGFGCVSVISE